MKRRSFLQKAIPTTLTLPSFFNPFSVKAYQGASPFLQLSGLEADTDKVIVLIQLNGGNDGLNMVIPLDRYSSYYSARSNVAIPEKKVLKLVGAPNSGLHPSMTGIQSLFNEGKASIVQSVGYPTPSFSHFRATDIWMSASNSNEVVTTGWTGRYLDQEFPGFPNGYPNTQNPDPLAIQIGSLTSLTLQGPVVNMGLSISDPNSFYNFLNGVTDPVPNSPWGNELSYVRMIAGQTQLYSTVIKNAYNKAANLATYPANNSLAAQLKIVARLIKGGLKTRVYMVSTGGFDTHSNQVSATDTAVGAHANLMGGLSNSIKSFMDDLKAMQVDDRVIGMTFSEFGRRIKSNASMGTDHGAAAPVILFGKNIRPGVRGSSPIIPTNVTVNDNIPFQFDFRSIYASILNQWFCVKQDALQTILFRNFQNIPIAINAACGSGIIQSQHPDGSVLIMNYPNPFTDLTRITFITQGGHTLVQVMDNQGRLLATLTDRVYAAGEFQLNFNAGFLPPGVYYARLQNGSLQQVHAMLKVRS